MIQKRPHIALTLVVAQELGHEVLPGPASAHALETGLPVVTGAAQKRPGDLCHIGLCDPELHIRVNYYYDENLNCNVAVKCRC
ncbi:MAG: hypothetical protein JO157_12775 [Acetobacteraceae bacterium]|nr:hypothetical protein [Acetobacteraceae bacterium]